MVFPIFPQRKAPFQLALIVMGGLVIIAGFLRSPWAVWLVVACVCVLAIIAERLYKFD